MRITQVEAPPPILKRPVRKVQKHAPPRRLPVRAGLPVGSMPVKFTAHEAVVWYRLHAEPGVIVPYQELLTLAWDSTYRWDDPDEYIRDLNRNLLGGVIYFMRRLLLASGDHWRIESVRGEGLRLIRTEN